MKLQDDEITLTYYALKIAKSQMENDLEKKKSLHPIDDFTMAEQELSDLNALFDKVSQAKDDIGTHINPFNYFAYIFLPEI